LAPAALSETLRSLVIVRKRIKAASRVVPLNELKYSEFAQLARQGNLIPVYREIRGDTETPVSAFLKLPSPAQAFLLESVEGGERWGRYSFLGDRPRLAVRQQGFATTIEENGRRTIVEEGAPLEALRKILAQHKLAKAGNLPRFVGGLVGYLSYGAIRWFEPRIPQRHGPDPEFPDAEWMLTDRMIVFDNLTHRIRLLACADLARHRSAKAAFAAAFEQIEQLSEALAKPIPPAPPQVRPHRIRDSWGRDSFLRSVERIREYIKAGDCFQAVLSRRLTAEYAGDPFELYRMLRGTSPAPYLFYLRFGERVLAGASPELLVRCEDGTVTVRPIAGTRPRGVNREEDARLEASLRADAKERAEHVMLVDLGRNDVGRVALPGTVHVDQREVIERFSHVMHLVSEISGALRKELDSLDALASTFPAGTLTGAPKVRAMEIIDELEPISRGPYGGAVGYVGHDGAIDMAIAIRSVALAGHKLRFQAGAGIVHDSDPAREFDETSHKMKAALVAFGATEPTPSAASKSRG
jgi:anthranilate synthase component 1